MRTGFARDGSGLLTGWDHVVQSAAVIFTTPLGPRVIMRTFGFGGLALLGRENLTMGPLMRWYMACVLAFELWEPCFRITKLDFPASGNSPSRLQQGQIGLALIGNYMPNALDGDFTVAAVKTLHL